MFTAISSRRALHSGALCIGRRGAAFTITLQKPTPSTIRRKDRPPTYPSHRHPVLRRLASQLCQIRSAFSGLCRSRHEARRLEQYSCSPSSIDSGPFSEVRPFLSTLPLIRRSTAQYLDLRRRGLGNRSGDNIRGGQRLCTRYGEVARSQYRCFQFAAIHSAASRLVHRRDDGKDGAGARGRNSGNNRRA